MRAKIAGSVVTIVCLMVSVSAQAAPITYTFTGVGNGTVDGVAWSGDFTFVFTGDTSNITSGSGEHFQTTLGGTFTDSNFSATLLSDNVVAVNNDPSFPRLGFFNSTIDNGGAIENSTFSAYNLDTSFGPITGTGADLLPTFNGLGHGFGTTGGETIELLGMTSLTFTATLQAVPEPPTVAMLGTGLAGTLGLFVRRRRTA